MPNATVLIDREEFLAQICDLWPDKEQVRLFLVGRIDVLSWYWYPISRREFFVFLAELGSSIESAKTPDDCWNAFAKALTSFNCPESVKIGWKREEALVG